MGRHELEALSSEDLQLLIAEAVAVLAARHAGAGLVDIRKGLNNEQNSDFKKKCSPVCQGRGTKRALDASSSKEAEQAEASQQPGAGKAAAPALAPPSQQSTPAKRTVVVASKRSGVKGVNWDPAKNAWHVKWREGGRQKDKRFCVHRYMEQGRGSREESDAQALRDAVAFREGLARRGVVKERQSDSSGVSWYAHGKCWRTQMKIGDKVNDYRFRPKDDTPEEIERARLAAVERRRELQAKHQEVVVRKDEQSCGAEPPDSGVKGIRWHKFGRYWEVDIKGVGKRLRQIFRPKDLTAEAIEISRLGAVQWHADMLRRKAAAVDP